MSRPAAWSVVYRGVESVDAFSLSWTFHVASADRETDVHIRTSTYGDIVSDIQTTDGYYSSTGDEALDARLVERVRQLLIWHDSCRVLDEARSRDRRPASRWAT